MSRPTIQKKTGSTEQRPKACYWGFQISRNSKTGSKTGKNKQIHPLSKISSLSAVLTVKWGFEKRLSQKPL